MVALSRSKELGISPNMMLLSMVATVSNQSITIPKKQRLLRDLAIEFRDHNITNRCFKIHATWVKD